MTRRSATAFRTREGRTVSVLPEIHDILKANAREQGMTLTEYVHELLAVGVKRPDLVPRLALAMTA